MNQMPCNIDYEKSILAGCILFKDIRSDALDFIFPDDFHSVANKKIFEAIVNISAKYNDLDIVTVVSYLKDNGNLEFVGGATYVSSLLDFPIPPNTETYCLTIKKLATLRSAIQVCTQSIQNCYDRPKEADDVINELQEKILSLDGSLPDRFFVSKADLTTQTIDRIALKQSGKQNGKRIRTGFPTIDNMTGGGFLNSKLVVLAARPGHGKTAMMCNLIANMASRGTKCGVLSLEMSKEDLDERWLAAGAEINSVKLTNSVKLSQEEWARLMDAADTQSRWPVVIDDSGGINIEELKRRSRKMKKMGCEIVFVDQLSQISGKRNLDRFVRYETHVNELALLKKELQIPIVLMCQLSRKIDDRSQEGKKPRLSDLKMTGSLEEEADIVLLGYRKYEDTHKEEDRNKAEWNLAKNRQGPTYRIEDMSWDGRFMRFVETTKEYDYINQY